MGEQADKKIVECKQQEVAMKKRILNINFPVEGHRRAAYEEEYGCAAWTEAALKAVVRWSPRGVVELGAGR